MMNLLGRVACLVLPLLLAAAAPAQEGKVPPPRPAKHAGHRPPSHARQQVAKPFERPDTPQVASQRGFAPAPVPDTTKTAPVSPVESRTHAEPTVFDLGMKYQGDGYVYGSSPQAMDDRRAAKAPGL